MEETDENFFVLKSHQARGAILDHAILFERIMDEFISLAFSNDANRKRELLNLIISEGMSFKYKARLVLRIIKKRIQMIMKDSNASAHYRKSSTTLYL